MELRDIRKLIKKSVREAIERCEDGLLLEMAFPRKTYKEKIDSLIPQILENWCLIRYCTITDNVENKSHWADELSGYLLTISRYSIKGNDAITKRAKVLSEIWNENDYDKPKFLNMTIANKFMKEKIDISSPEYKQVIEDCIASKDEIFDVVLLRDVQQINNYTRQI